MIKLLMQKTYIKQLSKFQSNSNMQLLKKHFKKLKLLNDKCIFLYS